MGARAPPNRARPREVPLEDTSEVPRDAEERAELVCCARRKISRGRGADNGCRGGKHAHNQIQASTGADTYMGKHIETKLVGGRCCAELLM